MKKKIILGIIFSFLVIGGAIGFFIYKDENTLVNGFMTKKQLREDYEFVWDFIENYYPYKNVCTRNGVDLAVLKKQYKKLLFEAKNEYEYKMFYYALLVNLTDYKMMGHLILDLRENSGGYTSLWEKGFIKPIISEEASSQVVFAVNTENKYFQFNIQEADRSSDIRFYRDYLEGYPKFKFSEKNIEDKKLFNSLLYETTIIEPRKKPMMFNGKIWILIGRKTASAAEIFALFMKNTKLISNDRIIPVTLIGKQTRGVYTGYNRAFLKLPNSGLVIQSDMGYGLNSDGSCITEDGIKPDIEVEELYALRDCMNLIKEEETK